jgi:hypothetical protein
MSKKITKKELKRLGDLEIKKNDKLWATTIKAQWNNKCLKCGAIKGDTYLDKKGLKKVIRIEAAHIIPREIRAFRWDLDNGIPLCSKHHKWSFKWSAHLNPFAFFNWFIDTHFDQYLRLSAKWKRYELENNI